MFEYETYTEVLEMIPYFIEEVLTHKHLWHLPVLIAVLVLAPGPALLLL